MTQINSSDTFNTWRLAFNSLDSDFRTGGLTRESISVNDTGGLGSLSYNSVNGVITYVGPSNVDIRSLFSVSGTFLTYDSATGQFGSGTVNPATYTTQGVASFDSDDFILTGGAVSLKAGLATTVNKGYASFDSADFVVTGGAVSLKLADVSVVDAGGLGSLTHNPGTNVITYTGPSNVDIRSLFSVSGGFLAYDSATGQFSSSNIVDATTTVKGIASFNTSWFTVTSGAVSLKANSVGSTELLDSSVGEAELKNAVQLIIYNSSGGVVKSLWGAGN